MAKTTLTARERRIAAYACGTVLLAGMKEFKPHSGAPFAKVVNGAVGAKEERRRDKETARVLARCLHGHRRGHGGKPLLSDLLRDPALNAHRRARLREIAARRMRVADALAELVARADEARLSGNFSGFMRRMRRAWLLTQRMDDFYWLALGVARGMKEPHA